MSAVGLTFEQWRTEMDAKYPRTPQPLSREDWWEMLEVLPPERWIRRGGFESFNLMEHAYGTVAQVFVWDHKGHRGWKFHAEVNTTHEQRVALALGGAT